MSGGSLSLRALRPQSAAIHKLESSAKVDSKETQEIMFMIPTRRILGFLMRNCSFQGAGEEIYLVGNEQARATESTMYRKKTKSKN